MSNSDPHQMSRRILGVRARVKLTKDGEARPTQVCIVEGKSNKQRMLTLTTDQDELDFIVGKFPAEWRDVKPDEDLSEIPVRHLKFKPVPLDVELSTINGTHLNTVGKQTHQAIKVASKFDGLQPGDTVVIGLGFGDELAYALARRGDTFDVPATVQRVPPIVLHDHRVALKLEDPEVNKDQDAQLLTELWQNNPELFYQVSNRDEQIIQLRLKYKQVEEAQKARIACEQRLIKRLRTEMYLQDPELYPEGSLEDSFLSAKANDTILQGLVKEENKRKSEMEKILKSLDVYSQVFSPIDGCGPAIAARLISGIQDVRRFSTNHKLKAYCGVHVRKGGKYADVPENKQFPRRRGGETSNWNDACRKALYLLVDQANKRPDSYWGKKLRENKVRWSALHPDASKMHVQKTAIWKTASQMVNYIFSEWKKLETGQKASSASA